MLRAYLTCAVLVVGAWGCGDSSGDTESSTGDTSSGSSGSTSAGGDELCTPGSTAVSGTINGAEVSSSGARSARLLNQISDPPSLALGWDGGNATFQWMGLASNATPIDVTGIIEVDGTAYCFGSGTLRLEDGGFDRFSVEQLTEADSNDPAMCPGGTAATGELDGCSDAE